MKRLLATTTAIVSATALPAVAQDAILLEGITITATADAIEEDRVGTSVEVIDGAALDAGGDIQLSQALRRLPGVSFTEAGPPGTQSQLRIRGGGSEYVAVFIDGIPVSDPSSIENSFQNFGGLTTGALRRVEILRGSQSALWGGSAVAGVVNVTTVAGEDAPEGTSQTVEVQGGSFGTVALDYGLTHRTGDLILSLGLSHVQSDGFSAADEDNGNTENDAYDQTRLSFGARYALSDTVTVGVNGFAETGEAEFDEFTFTGPADGTPGDDRQTRDTFGLRGFVEVEAGAWTHTAALSYYEIERVAGSLTVGPTSFASPVNTFNADRVFFDYQATGDVSEALTLSFGLDAESETATYANALGGSNTVETWGTWAEATWTPAPGLDLTGTIRADENSAFGGFVTGRLAFSWAASDALRLRGAVATGYRAPSLDELYGSYPGSEFLGNPALRPEESVSYEIGADYGFANGAEVSATLFRLDVDNLITYAACPGFPCPPGTFNTLQNVAGTSTRQGVELAALWPVSDRLTLTAAYTHTDAKTATGARLPEVPVHDLALGLDAVLSERLSLGLALAHVADRANSAFDPEPFEDYTVVDATLSYAVSDGVEAFLRVDNVFDEKYQTISGYGTSDRAVFLGLRAAF